MLQLVVRNVGFSMLGKGEGYSKLKPLIALTLTDFVLFPEQDMVISNFVFKERSRELSFSTNPIEFVFVELPNLKKKIVPSVKLDG